MEILVSTQTRRANSTTLLHFAQPYASLGKICMHNHMHPSLTLDLLRDSVANYVGMTRKQDGDVLAFRRRFSSTRVSRSYSKAAYLKQSKLISSASLAPYREK